MTSVFYAMNSVSPMCCFRSNQILSVQPKHTTRCHRFHNRKQIVCHLFYVSSNPAPLNESCPLTSITFYQVLYVVTQGSNPFTTNSRGGERDHIFIKPFLEIDVKGGERDHIKAYHFRESITFSGGERSFRGRERSPGGENTSRKYFSRIPDAWCSRGEMPHVFLRGKTCSYVLTCISLH